MSLESCFYFSMTFIFTKYEDQGYLLLFIVSFTPKVVSHLSNYSYPLIQIKMHNSNFTTPVQRHRFFFFFCQRKEATGKATSTSHLSVYLQIGVVPGADQV